MFGAPSMTNLAILVREELVSYWSKRHTFGGKWNKMLRITAVVVWYAHGVWNYVGMRAIRQHSARVRLHRQKRNCCRDAATKFIGVGATLIYFYRLEKQTSATVYTYVCQISTEKQTTNSRIFRSIKLVHLAHSWLTWLTWFNWLTLSSPLARS